MQLLLDGSQCKWLVNLKRIAWALKDVAFRQERAGAALAEHVPRWRGAAAPGRRPLPPEGRSRVHRPRLDRAPPPLVRPLRARDGAPAEQPQVGDDEGDTKFVSHLIQVIAVASPRTITSSWLTVVKDDAHEGARSERSGGGARGAGRRRARRASRARTQRIRAVPSQAARRVATGGSMRCARSTAPWATAVSRRARMIEVDRLYLRVVRGGQGNQLDVARVNRPQHPNLEGSQAGAAGKDESGVGDALGGLPRHAFLRCILVPPLPLVSPRTLRSADTDGRCSSARGLLSRRSRRPP